MKDGVINVLKVPGMTSHDVVNSLRKIYGEKRIGHMGTLDPAAAGVLPVAIGKATRLIEFSEPYDKAYRAQILFGLSTDTGDDTGTVLQTSKCDLPSEFFLRKCLASFLGEQEQEVPKFSAVRVDGKRLYDMAREGVETASVFRRISINDLVFISATKNSLTIDVTCSKGTYIRTLCVDIGRKLDCPATMSLLIRTRVGPFFIGESKTLEEIESAPFSCLIHPERIVSHYDAITLSDEKLLALKQGKRISYEDFVHRENCVESFFRLYDMGQHFWGIVHADLSQRQLIPYKIMEKPI